MVCVPMNHAGRILEHQSERTPSWRTHPQALGLPIIGTAVILLLLAARASNASQLTAGIPRSNSVSIIDRDWAVA